MVSKKKAHKKAAFLAAPFLWSVRQEGNFEFR